MTTDKYTHIKMTLSIVGGGGAVWYLIVAINKKHNQMTCDHNTCTTGFPEIENLQMYAHLRMNRTMLMHN